MIYNRGVPRILVRGEASDKISNKVARISVRGNIQQNLLNKDFRKILKNLYKIRTKI